jgi:4-diphosphocytidyl-2-C-methyl-D-erythritol kinase
VRRAPATAKITLSLVVGPPRRDGKHEVATVLQRIDLADRISLEPAEGLEIRGFPEDTLVRDALLGLAAEAGVEPRWTVRIEKRIPVAAGLGGGSSDAATALRLANETLAEPLSTERLKGVAAEIGADAPYFLAEGPQLATGDGRDLSAVHLPQDYYVLIVLLHGARKASTADVYSAFDERRGARGFSARRDRLRQALTRIERPRDLSLLPPNDLATSDTVAELRELGAFRADVSGAGPAVYGLFMRRADAARARAAFAGRGRTWLTVPTWYG